MATRHSKLMIGGGITLAVGPILGVGVTTLMMFQPGKDAPIEAQAAAERIGDAVLFSAIGSGVGFVGLAVFLTGFFIWLNSPERLAARAPRQQRGR